MLKKKKYDFAMYMGRFQPFHDGHVHVASMCRDIADNVILLVGGADKARQAKNPWTLMERIAMISRAFNFDDVYISGIHDHPYSDGSWAEEVRSEVRRSTGPGDFKIALVGHNKDASSYYLKLFPEWDFVEAENYHNIDATAIRDIYFSHPHINILANGIPSGTRDIMYGFAGSNEYKRLAEEHAYIKKYKQLWAGSPFPNILVTVDIAVIKGGKLLLIRRGGMPGKGLLALPGGYIEARETIVKSAMRELQEETGLVLEDFSRRCIAQEVFDHPDRSQLGRCITHLFVINADGLDIEPKAGDDAASVQWVNSYELSRLRDQFSGDHFYMGLWAITQYKERV